MLLATLRRMPAQPVGDAAPPDGLLPPAALAELPSRPFGIYVHIPFCTSRCGYCDFNTYTAQELGPGVSRSGYVESLIGELRLARECLGPGVPAVSTVFFGGGTPTLLPAEHLGYILTQITELFGIAPGAEITTEANPETVTPVYFEHLLSAGFTRVSLGMQSVVPKMLEILDRTHRPGRAQEAVAQARSAGFAHVNLDLIYGTPYETEQFWQQSLDAAIAAEPDHISAYALVVEPGTALARQVSSGVVPAPDDDVLADRYIQADQTLAAAGYQWYEVSNFARGPQAQCQHNLLYWRDHNWWGAGAGAHSHIGGVRWWNVKHPARYAALLEAAQSPAAGRETLDTHARMTERIMLGIRLAEGISMQDIDEQAQQKALEMLSWGLLDSSYLDAGRIVLTQRGRLMADAVVRELMPG